MTPHDYWREAAESALDSVGVTLTTGQAETVADQLVISCEQVSMAFGTNCIPDPRSTEIEDLKRKHREELKQAESREEAYRLAYARRIRAEPNQVYLGYDGEVLVDRRL